MHADMSLLPMAGTGLDLLLLSPVIAMVLSLPISVLYLLERKGHG